jgi:hypothetical protein
LRRIEHVFDDDPIARIREGLAGLAVEDRRSWSGAARSARVVELAAVAERLRAELLRCVGEWDARADWAVDGILSPRAWLTHRTGVSGIEAARIVSGARLVHRHDATGKALAAGDISCAHVDVLAPMVRGREEEFADHEETLVDAAVALAPDDLAVAARRWRSIVDDGQDARRMLDRRGLGIATTLHGMGVVEGELDPEGTELLLEAIDRAAPPDPVDAPEPPRTLRQRRADGLVDICREYISRHSDADDGPRVAAHVDVTMDLVTLLGAEGAVDGLDPRALRCELRSVGPIPSAVAERLCCDSAVGRVVMNGPSEVLDLGRLERLVSPAIRRAVVARDHRCVWPGCDRPARWCDAHHLLPWERGGPTSVENCALLCRRHHVLVHEGAWMLLRNLDGTYELKPPPTEFVPRRRRERAPPVAA